LQAFAIVALAQGNARVIALLLRANAKLMAWSTALAMGVEPEPPCTTAQAAASLRAPGRGSASDLRNCTDRYGKTARTHAWDAGRCVSTGLCTR